MAPDGRRADVAVCRGQGLRVVGDIGKHGPKILEIEQQQALIVGHLEDQRQHAGLHIVEIEQPGEEQRPEVGHRGAHGMPLLAEQVPEDRGIGAELVIADAELCQPFLQLRCRLAGLADAGKIALHIGQEHGNAAGREALGNDLQRHGLAGAGGAGDEPMPVGIARQELQWRGGLRDDDAGNLGHGLPPVVAHRYRHRRNRLSTAAGRAISAVYARPPFV